MIKKVKNTIVKKKFRDEIEVKQSEASQPWKGKILRLRFAPSQDDNVRRVAGTADFQLVTSIPA